MVIDHLILVVGWLIYFVIHSFMASLKVKEIIKRKAPQIAKIYRFLYSVSSAIGLFAILLFSGMIATPYYFQPNQLMNVMALILSIWGVLVIKSSFRLYSLNAFLGFTVDPILNNNSDPPKLITTGILSKVRHPIYSGTILIVLGFLTFRFNLTNCISTACVFLYLYIGIRLEEKKLIHQFGQQYKEYMHRVPMLIPKRKSR